MNEQTLILRLKRGDSAAYRELVEHFQERVINTCYRFLYNREDAEDAAQEVFIDVYNSISKFKSESTLSTWLYRIAVNRSIDLIRKKKRKKRFAPIKSIFGMEEQGQQLPAPEHWNPEKTLEADERMAILMQAIDTLPENQRVAFTLSKCENFGNKEISRIMDLSLSSVESLMHRAKKKLSKSLFQYFEKDLKRKKTLMLILFIFIAAKSASFGMVSRLK